MAPGRKIIFFAYQGRRTGKADENVDAIKHGISSYNQHQTTYNAISWEDYTKTSFISQTVLTAIDRCEIFAADLTYFNHNVLFELGYAIAKDKEIVVFLNKKIKDAASIYEHSFLKDLKYQELTNSNDIQTALQKRVYSKGWMQNYVKLETLSAKSKDLFYIESPHPNQPSLDLTELLMEFSEKHKLNLISENKTEIQYRPINWYFSNIYQSKISIIHYLGECHLNYVLQNAQNSFWAGVACGFKLKTLLVAPSQYRAPLDYHDIMIQYDTTEQLCRDTKQWLMAKYSELVAESAVIPVKQPTSDRGLSLLKLGVGCDIAESEKENLLDYFVSTYSYEKAKEAKSTIIIGRKGSGKSAIYIKLADDLYKDAKVLLVNLKPESDELLQNIDLASLFPAKSGRINFFFSIWKCVILSKLLIQIYERIKQITPTDVPLTESAQAINEFYSNNTDYLNCNFMGLIAKISEKYQGDRHPQKPSVVEYLYKYYIGPLKKVLLDYLETMNNKKYSQIVILGDNLDKTWNPDHNLSVQVEMILTLLEVEEKIKHELPNIEFKLRSILFLRKDIFEYICKHISEPDKLQSMTHEINWENYSGKLKELVDNRFRFLLQLDESANINEQIWKDFFEIGKKNVPPFETIEEIITKRPRDLLYFITRLFESAVNNDHQKVDNKDLEFAIDSYTKFLNNNLIAEVRAVFPEIPDILIKLQEYRGQTLEYETFCKIVKEFNYDKQKLEELVEELFNKGYMLGFDEKTQTPFSDIQKLKDKLNEKRWGFFKNKVYVIAHAKYYYIRNKRLTSF